MRYQNSTHKWLATVVVLQILILLGLWGAGPGANMAKADGIPDAGAQRDQMIEQQKATNQKLDKLMELLSGGELKVTVARSDDTHGK